MSRWRNLIAGVVVVLCSVFGCVGVPASQALGASGVGGWTTASANVSLGKSLVMPLAITSGGAKVQRTVVLEELSNPVDGLIRRRSVGGPIGRVVRPVCRL